MNDFLVKNFSELIDYDFTQKLEAELDEISNGTKVWHKIIAKFYKKLKPIVDDFTQNTTDRLLGKDYNNVKIFATVAKFGP